MHIPEQQAKTSEGHTAGLEACPFCRSMPYPDVQNDDCPLPESLGAGFYRVVWCEVCGSEGGKRRTDAEAIAAWNTRAPDTERAELLARVAEHERTITRMHRQAATSRRFWFRDAEEALAGKPQSLRNRIEMAKADPVDVVLSDAALAKAQPQTHPLDQERGR